MIKHVLTRFSLVSYNCRFCLFKALQELTPLHLVWSKPAVDPLFLCGASTLNHTGNTHYTKKDRLL